MTAKLTIGNDFNDTLTVNSGDIKQIDFVNSSTVWVSSQNIFAKRTHVKIKFDPNVPIGNILPQNLFTQNHQTDIFLPDTPSGSNDSITKPYTYTLGSDYNYAANAYYDFIESQNVLENNLMSLYYQETSLNNKYVPQIESFKRVGFPITQKRMKEFQLYRQSYDVPTITLPNKIVFDYNHTFEENSRAEQYPLYNELNFSYQMPSIMAPLFKTTNQNASNNLFERMAMMLSFGVFDVLNPTTLPNISGLKSYPISLIQQQYLSNIDQTGVLVLSEDYYNYQVDWSHIFQLNNIISTVSSHADLRTYEDLYRGKKCKNEFLFFKINKYKDDIVGQPITSFIVPASKEYVSMIDTQIHRNKTYTYDVTGYCVVFGSNSVFHNLQVTPGAGPAAQSLSEASFFADVYPDIHIVEVPLFSVSNKVIATPPMRPIVSFHNESSSSRKIKIYLELDKGEIEDDFTEIMPSDLSQFENVPDLPSGLKRFGFTKQAASFELFKSEEKPQSYSDFQTKLIDTYTNTNDSINMMIHDFITPGKKYYYTFRALSDNGMISNPTPVYEVELVKTADESILKVNTISFEEKTNSVASKSFRSLIDIFPAFEQLDFVNLVDSPNITGLDPIELGDTPYRVWGKKFKIRVRSNDSGKVIDFNVKFNLIKENSEEDFSV